MANTKPDAAQITYQAAGTGAEVRDVESKLGEVVSVRDFGAVGDGVTNDTDAFSAASAYITSLGGGKLVIPRGTYVVGKQTFAGATGKGYSYQSSPIINIVNCVNPVIIEFQGATLKLATGLKYGSFDPVTGAVYNPGSMPFVNTDYRADVGCMLFTQNNTNVLITGVCELDGNSASAVLGGAWGDTGRQLASCGLLAYNNLQFQAENIYTHHHCLDGVIIGWTGLTETSPKHPHTLININSDYNARQGLSVVGTNGLVVINSKFNNTGRGALISAPGAGIDLEAELTLSRNISFINCECINNIGVGMVADSGDTRDVTFERCKFVGTATWSIWPRKAGLVFRDCLIVGSAVNAYSSLTAPNDSTKFYNCKFSDNSALSPTGVVYASGYVILFDGTPNVLLDGCTIEATRESACLITGNSSGSPTIKDSVIVFSAGTSYLANRSQAASFQDAHISGLTVLDAITVDIPADGYFIYMPGGTLNLRFSGVNQCISPAGKIKWFSWSTGAGGATGILGENNSIDVPKTALALSKSTGGDFIGYYGTIKIISGPSAPTGGSVGDRCINSNPVVGQPKGWVCTAPGTWVSEGNL